MKLNKKDVWTGQYRGIGFEIVSWGSRERDRPETHNWNYYIYIPLNLVKDKALAKKLIAKRKKTTYGTIYDYYNGIPIIHNIGMHGGVTFYDVINGYKSKLIKIGCDYGHLYDEPYYETIDSVSGGCLGSIDELKNLDLLYNQCQGDGSLVEEKEGYYTPDKDRFYSIPYINAMPEPQRANWLKGLVIT